jgi:hypothetical protein
VDFLYYDGSPPTYDYEYYNDYNDVSKVGIENRMEKDTVHGERRSSLGWGVAH